MSSPTCVLLRHALSARPETLAIQLGPLESDSASEIPQKYKQLFLDHCQQGDSMDGDDIQMVESQFARLVGNPVVILHNAGLDSSSSQRNMRACRLSTDITEGKHTPIFGNVIILSAKPGVPSMTTEIVEQLDNAIHDELLEYFCQGVKPQPKDLKRIVDEYRSGSFRYNSYHFEEKKAATKSQPNKMESAEETLPGWG